MGMGKGADLRGVARKKKNLHERIARRKGQ